MSPAPSLKHQEISINLTGEIYSIFKNHQCRFFSAPFDVRLPQKSKEDKEILTVVQPNLRIVCDENKLDKRGCIGTPDLVIKILSPGQLQKRNETKI